MAHHWHPRVASIEGRFVSASNATLLGATEDGDPVVYKPIAGERPLWDFEPSTLAIREVLTYETSAALGIDVVPETALGDGLYGPGSVQRFIDVDLEFDALGAARAGAPELWPVAVLDLLCNNADRKLGHILQSKDGRLIAIDHGLTFHPEDKLRTVLWAFAGKQIPQRLIEAVGTLTSDAGSPLESRIEARLGPQERKAFRRRVERLMATSRHPNPPEDRPAIPWPPY